jgi:hypothetical protein
MANVATVEEAAALLEDSYQKTLWEVGGDSSRLTGFIDQCADGH